MKRPLPVPFVIFSTVILWIVGMITLLIRKRDVADADAIGMAVAAVAYAVLMIVLAAILRARRIRRRSEEMARLAASLGLSFHHEVSRSDLQDFKALELIRRFLGASDRISGVMGGVAVQLLDYTYFTPRSIKPNVTIVLLRTDSSVPASVSSNQGLHVESAGGCLAVFRLKRQVVPADECPQLLRDAMAIRQRLLDA